MSEKAAMDIVSDKAEQAQVSNEASERALTEVQNISRGDQRNAIKSMTESSEKFIDCLPKLDISFACVEKLSQAGMAAREFLQVGIPVSELLAAGFNSMDLLSAGVYVQDLINSGISASTLEIAR